MAKMMLLRKADLKNLPALYAQSEVEDPTVHVKFFNARGAGTWLATEYDPENQMFFGAVTLDGDYWELGYFSLGEMSNLSLMIERDRHFDPQPLSTAKAA
jgi:hypothetical protein